MAKTTKPTVRFHNIETDEIIDREMNDDEFAQYQIDQTNAETLKAEIVAKEAQRQVILDRLGLTVDEAKLILG
jgi:hypothetical protein